MEIAVYLRIFRRWLWLIILFAFVGASFTYITSVRQTKQYTATVTVFVGNFIRNPNPTSGEIGLGQQLAQTYSVIVTTYDLQQATINAGNFPLSVEELSGTIVTNIVPNTSLLQISITYSDPILAADIANQLAEQLIIRSPTSLTSSQESQRDLLEEQISNVNSVITQTQQELLIIDEQLSTVSDDAEQDYLNRQRDLLLTRITDNNTTLAQLYTALQGFQSQTNELRIVDRAQIPGQSQGASAFQIGIIGAMIGLVLAYGLAIVLEYLNDTIRTPEDVTTVLALPVLASIFRFGQVNDTYSKRLVTHLHPSSPAAEGYRALRTNLLYSSRDEYHNQDKYTFVITSASPEEGKSVTAANLAVTMAASGLRVLLIDADLRRPKIHQVFDLSNETGLTTLLFAEPLSSEEAIDDYSRLADKLRQCIKNTSIPRLRVITAGYSVANPAEILGTSLMKRWYQEFIAASDVDVVLFDTPPALVVADSNVLAATINAEVLLVIRAGHTRRGAALRAKEQFDNLNVPVAGVALNQLNLVDQDSYYGYDNSYYYNRNTQQIHPSGWKRLLLRFTQRN